METNLDSLKLESELEFKQSHWQSVGQGSSSNKIIFFFSLCQGKVVWAPTLELTETKLKKKQNNLI